MLSQSMNSSCDSLHDDLFKKVECLFLKSVVVKGGNITLKNNIPQLAKIIYKNGRVKAGDDLIPIIEVLVQIRNDGYDLGSVITVIGTAYNSVIEQSKANYNRTLFDVTDDLSKVFDTTLVNPSNNMPDFGRNISKLFNKEVLDEMMKNMERGMKK